MNNLLVRFVVVNGIITRTALQIESSIRIFDIEH